MNGPLKMRVCNLRITQPKKKIPEKIENLERERKRLRNGVLGKERSELRLLKSSMLLAMANWFSGFCFVFGVFLKRERVEKC